MKRLVRTFEDVMPQAWQADDAVIGDTGLPLHDQPLSFPRILDYTFPTALSEEPVIQIGEVTYVGDGVIHVSGLDRARIDEIVEIKTAKGIVKALILGLQENRLDAVVLGDYSAIKRGHQARSTASKLKVPVGKSLLGRVINPMGQPIDGLGPIKADEHRDVEFPAPGVVDRVPITIPLHTGIINIDTTIPIGRGQRELVIGDRKTGKTRTMLDIISNQKGQDVVCIYVGVGIQAAKAKAAVELLEKRGVLNFTTLVIAQSDDPPPLQYIAPYVGAAIGEHYMYQGKHALVIFDDLSKQAKAYRQVSLLLKRSPGRDAYPGDIFFLHSRLLERASQLNSKLGGGSMTALPVAETQVGDISDYIITNLMSITDGHIYLDANMMHEGILPAINSGASVSRIGGKVQAPMLRKVGELAGRILARYNEVRSFETINTEVADETLRDIRRGKRIREIFSQDSELSLTDDEQVVMLALAASSRMDHLDLKEIQKLKTTLIPYYRDHRTKDIETLIQTGKDLDQLDTWLDAFFTSYCHYHQISLPPSQRT
jgi:F-type H+/Na+-transporting ATPase subunit alpha